MKHFKNPQNVGRLKNPSGVGKAGNLVCLLPGQNIHINNSLKEINKISRGTKVLSSNGKYNIISKATERNYAGEILIIKNKLGTINLTPDHLILAIKIPKGDKFLRTVNKKKLVSGWLHAGQLKKGDIILYPILKKEKKLEYLKINIPKPKWDFKSKEIPNKIPLNSDFLRLSGYFLSEGNIQDKPCRTFISFSLNIKENEIVKDIKKISKNLFNLDVTVRKMPERKAVVVYLFSARLARFFKEIFRNGAENKIIPDFIMSLPPERQKPLIYGLWKGDGYINLNRIGQRGGYSTISYKLAQQIKMLLLRQKIIPSIYKEKAKEIRGVKHKEAYRIHVGQRDSLKKLASILGIKYIPKSYPSEKGWFDNNFLYTPITKIVKKQYQGKVYNLEVENSHSFTSEAFCVHNCGDIMKLYLKIGENKKGEKIIEDIRFETLGCIVAIANTSLLTTLVKGKTIKEALSFKKEDLIKELGQPLPPFKIHCSVLAVDALQEAIYDYYSKNKIKIPEDLEKEHQRIIKTKEELEKRYKGFQTFEKEILG